MLERRGIEDTKIIEVVKAHSKVIVAMDKDFGYLAISPKSSRTSPTTPKRSWNPE